MMMIAIQWRTHYFLGYYLTYPFVKGADKKVLFTTHKSDAHNEISNLRQPVRIYIHSRGRQLQSSNHSLAKGYAYMPSES